MSKSEKILKNYRATVNAKAESIKVDDNGFFDIMDADGKTLESGDLLKYSSSDKVGTFKA